MAVPRLARGIERDLCRHWSVIFVSTRLATAMILLAASASLEKMLALITKADESPGDTATFMVHQHATARRGPN